MNHRPSSGRRRLVGVAVLVLALSSGTFTEAQDREHHRERGETTLPRNILKALKGDWLATFSGSTACGFSTMWLDFHLDETGHGTVTLASEHFRDCGDSVTSGAPMQIVTLNPDGSGVIFFGCDTPNCGFSFDLQVSHNKQMFNMTAEFAPGNFLAGLAVKQ